MIETLPTPFGLIRSGVAPDHQDVKSCQTDFTQVAQNDRFAFYGNVTVGGGATSTHDAPTNIAVAELQQHYHAVVFCTGATSDRMLGIPGEDLTGVHSARAVVNWYNSQPDFVNYPVDLSAPYSGTCVIIGQGNVAVDCARILSCCPSELKTSDIADYALTSLKNSNIQKVIVLGRRGHVQASFTMKELRELTKLKGASFVVKEEDLDASMTQATEEEIKTGRVPKRMNKLLRTVAGRSVEKEDTELQLSFLRSPIEILPSTTNPNVVGSIRVSVNTLEGPVGQQRAVDTGESEIIPCDIVLRSVGYLGVPLEGVAFNEATATISNAEDSAGRIVDPETGEVMRGMFTSGWAKRGPSGIVGTNIPCAKETVQSILEDAHSGVLPTMQSSSSSSSSSSLYTKMNAARVNWGDYLNIDQHEVETGMVKGKVRDKMLSRTEMLQVAKGSS